MSQIANLRTVLALLTAFTVIGALIFQQRELSRLRVAIGEFPSLRSPQRASSSESDALPTNIDELRQEASEVHRLRAEVAQLRREKAEMSALQASVDKLAMEFAAAPEMLNHSSGSMAIVGSGFRTANRSALVEKASSLAHSSPQEAAQWVSALPEGEERNQAALAVIGQWIESDSVAAAAWATQFAEGPLREQALARVGREWGMKDWNATAGWLETLPAGSSKDSAIGAFITAADGYDIRLATEWANRTEDPESRAARVTGMVQRWLGENNAAARAWIQQAQLPAGMAERLLSGQ